MTSKKRIIYTCFDSICQTLRDQIETLPNKKIFVQAALESDTVRNIKYRFVYVMNIRDLTSSTNYALLTLSR